VLFRVPAVLSGTMTKGEMPTAAGPGVPAHAFRALCVVYVLFY
jgi:hypothetical protein